MIVGRQVLDLGNVVWNELKVEDGIETWVKWLVREGHTGGEVEGWKGGSIELVDS